MYSVKYFQDQLQERIGLPIVCKEFSGHLVDDEFSPEFILNPLYCVQSMLLNNEVNKIASLFNFTGSRFICTQSNRTKVFNVGTAEEFTLPKDFSCQVTIFLAQRDNGDKYLSVGLNDFKDKYGKTMDLIQSAKIYFLNCLTVAVNDLPPGRIKDFSYRSAELRQKNISKVLQLHKDSIGVRTMLVNQTVSNTYMKLLNQTVGKR